MNWDIAIEIGKREAAAYAERKAERGVNREAAYNGYFDGYMANAAEREALREILRQKEKPSKIEAPKIQTLDSLI